MLYQQICTQRFNDILKRRLEVNYFEWQSTQFEFTNNQSPLCFGSGDGVQRHINTKCLILASEWTHTWESAEGNLRGQAGRLSKAMMIFPLGVINPQASAFRIFCSDFFLLRWTDTIVLHLVSQPWTVAGSRRANWFQGLWKQNTLWLLNPLISQEALCDSKNFPDHKERIRDNAWCPWRLLAGCSLPWSWGQRWAQVRSWQRPDNKAALSSLKAACRVCVSCGLEVACGLNPTKRSGS